MEEAAARRLLGVRAGATRTEVETAFRLLAMSTHPDRGGEAGAFRAVVDARRALMSPRPRRVTPVTVVVNQGLLRQVVITVVRRLLERDRPGRRVI